MSKGQKKPPVPPVEEPVPLGTVPCVIQVSKKNWEEVTKVIGKELIKEEGVVTWVDFFSEDCGEEPLYPLITLKIGKKTYFARQGDYILRVNENKLWIWRPEEFRSIYGIQG